MKATFMGYKPTWCPGCGDFGIHVALQKAFMNLGFTPSSVGVCFGIGCSGNMNDFLNAYAMHGLHGRGLPNALGMKLANHEMPVVLIAGDGDFYGEGGNHFTHACRGNHDVTIIVHDNAVYGLTTGQVSPRASKGHKSKTTPSGVIENPVNPLALAVSQGATFVAEGFSFDTKLYELLEQAVQHKGLSIVNILQPCHTFNKINSKEYYEEHSYHLDESYDPTDRQKALELSMQPVYEERFPLGVIYKEESVPFHEQLPQLKKQTLRAKKRFSDFDSLAKPFA